MKIRLFSLFRGSCVPGMLVLLAACGGGGGSSTGTLNLALTDASVDKAKAVVVEFTGVQLQSAGGERIDHDFVDDTTGEPVPRHIDLLALTGGTTEMLLDGVTLPAGRYNWIRLKVNAKPGVIDSYIDLMDGTQHSLYIPSGAETGLKLNRGFDVPEDGMASFTIDFDLRKSVHYPTGLDGDRILRPTLRLVDDNTAGALTGTVASGIIDTDPDCSGDYVGAVYVFDGGDTVDDLDGTADPVTSARVPNDGTYAYTVAFLPEGDYKVVFSCDADIDDPGKDADTDPTDGPVDLIGGAPVSITAGKTTTYHFE